jgi:plasmid stabilization system protein ParE
LFQTALNLGDHPYLGRISPESRNSSIRDIVKGPYRIVYTVNDADKLVQIVRIWHGARGYLPGQI